VTPYGGDFMLSTPVLTSINGRFYSDASVPGLVSFAPGCVDSLARASIKYWSVAPTSPGANVTVAPISTLVEPYRRLRCNAGPEGCRALGDDSAFDDVFELFGFPAQDGVSFRSWQGIVMGTRFGVSIYVLNQRIASVLTAASEVANTLCEGFATSDNLHVQLSAQAALLDVVRAKATPAARLEALSSPDDIAAVISRTLDNLRAPEAGLTCRALDAQDRAALLPVIAKVRAGRFGGVSGSVI
jgi:hypothetical protein